MDIYVHSETFLIFYISNGLAQVRYTIATASPYRWFGESPTQGMCIKGEWLLSESTIRESPSEIFP